MRRSILCLAAAFSIMAAPGVASAGAMAPGAQSAVQVAPAGGNLILVAGGCGAGFHRSPRGYCRPNRYVHPVHHVRRCVTRWTHHGWRRFCRYY